MPFTALTHEEHVSKVKLVHGDRFVVKGIYFKSDTKIEYLCTLCDNIRSMRPDVVSRGGWCKSCSHKEGSKRTHSAHVHAIKNKFNGMLRVLDQYQNISEPIRYKCILHKQIFKASPATVLHRRIHCCDKGRIKSLRSSIGFGHGLYVKKLKKLTGNRWIVTENYVNTLTPILHKCNLCKNTQSIIPQNLLHGIVRCTNCQISRGYSSTSQIWLSILEKKLKIKIQRQDTGGEYKIPLTRYKADGYNKHKNIIFEFYGDEFHGHPILEKELNAYSIPMKKLRDSTLEREKKISQLGYHQVIIWEYTFKNNFDKWLTKFMEWYKELPNDSKPRKFGKRL